ncbi:type 1 fimbrial protein [Stenotrophomonas maltophilia]|nr:type 1 fimbrial protein [Stenotrophomonas maltophilia]MBN4962837.1 type 1 fimbrial protein [Stenotrophomonas maltophilia]
MNKLAIALSAALSLGAAASANAADATISFRGTIDATTCSVGVGGSDATGTTVTLRRASKTQIETGSDVSKETPFTIVVGDDGNKCPGTTSILNFETGLDSSGRIANDDAATAKNVALAVVNSKGNVVDLRDPDILESTTLNDGVYTHALKARYMRVDTTEEVTAGTFVGAVGVNIGFR